jgi:hypothetical protein
MHATVRYNTLRLAMVILVGGVCYLAGARGIVLVALALIISLPLSFILLARWRHAMIEEIAAGRMGGPARRLSARLDAGAAAEDAALDAEQAAQQDASPPAQGESTNAAQQDRREDPPAP